MNNINILLHDASKCISARNVGYVRYWHSFDGRSPEPRDIASSAAGSLHRPGRSSRCKALLEKNRVSDPKSRAEISLAEPVAGMREYRSDSPEEAKRQRQAGKLAKAQGWFYRGGYYVHPTRGRYRAKDMDGWADVCENEDIENDSYAAH